MIETHFRQLTDFSTYLTGRREAILKRWRIEAETDQEQTTARTLTTAQFNDHIPEVLNAFECSLRMRVGDKRADAAEKKRKLEEVKHGLHRWQQGYRLRELIHDWGHLQLCLSRHGR